MALTGDTQKSHQLAIRLQIKPGPSVRGDRTLVPFPAVFVLVNLDVSSTRGRAVQRRFAAS